MENNTNYSSNEVAAALLKLSKASEEPYNDVVNALHLKTPSDLDDEKLSTENPVLYTFCGRGRKCRQKTEKTD